MTSTGAAMDAAPQPPSPALTSPAGTHDRGPPSRQSRTAWCTLLAVTLLALVADLWSKHLAFEHVADQPVEIHRDQVLAVATQAPGELSHHLIPRHDAVTVIPRVLEFQLVLNAGAVFGMGQGQRYAFMAFTTVAIVAAVGVFAFWTRSRDRWAHIAIGLLIAGGLGNFYDRLTYGCVRDFIHPLPNVAWPFGWTIMGRREIWPYVSNVADAFLLVGIAILAVYLWRHDPKRRASPSQPPGAPASTPQPTT